MRTLLGERGIYQLTPHARERIAERFGVGDAAEQWLWLVEQLGTATRLCSNLSGYYTTAPRILWCCAGGVRIVSDGDEIITCWRDGDVDDEGEGTAA